ncbi:MAG: hypothetical protein VB137_12260 [Burkholderia sp.]
MQRVCQVLDFPRSTIYAERARALNKVTPVAPVRRDPKPKAPDHKRLAAVRGRSDWHAVRRRRGAQSLGTLAHSGRHPHVPRPCLAADAREHGLLSPHRQPQKPPNAHDGRMTADRPNERWGTDGAKVQTVDEGLVWIFAAVDH